MALVRPQRFQVSLGSLLLLMSVAAIGAALFAASIVLGTGFLIIACTAWVRTDRVNRLRRANGAPPSLFTTAKDLLRSFWMVVGLIFLSIVTLTFTVAVATIHVAIKGWVGCRRIVEALSLPRLLLGLIKLLDNAWRRLVVMNRRLVTRLLSPGFDLTDLGTDG